MGAGIAKQIANTYPEVEKTNRQLFRTVGADDLFGTIKVIRCHDGRQCVNMYSQYGFGRDVNTAYTDYDKMRDCLSLLADYLRENVSEDTPVGIPYGIGCGLGGGDWRRVRKMIEEFDSRISQDVYIISLPRYAGYKERRGVYACR